MKKKKKFLLIKQKFYYLFDKQKFYCKKKKFISFFLRNKFKINKLFFYINNINIFKYKKNVFINCSNSKSGNIFYKASCGSFIKRKSLRKTFFGVQNLFKNFLLNDIIKKKTKNIFFIFNIRASFFLKNGFKRLLKNFFNNNNKDDLKMNIIKINKIILKPHNGIRKKKKKRK